MCVWVFMCMLVYVLYGMCVWEYRARVGVFVCMGIVRSLCMVVCACVFVYVNVILFEFFYFV